MAQTSAMGESAAGDAYRYPMGSQRGQTKALAMTEVMNQLANLFDN